MWILGAAAALSTFCSLTQAGHASVNAPRPLSARARADAWIPAEAQRLSGRLLSVTCADGRDDWARTVGSVGLPAADAEEYYGFSLIQAGEMHLSPYVCRGLQLGRAAASRRSNELQVAWSTDVLLHESAHLGRFTADESLTEACARVALPAELHRLYGIAYHSAEIERLTSSAALFRRTMSAAYQGGECPPSPR